MRQRFAATAAALSVVFSFLAAASARAVPLASPIVTPSPLSLTSVQWSWTLISGATGYRVLSSTSGGDISGDLSAAATFFSLTGLSTNTAAAVTIEAFGNGFTPGDSALSTAYSAAATPSGSNFLGGNGSAISLSWATNGNPSGTNYQIYWSSSGGTPVVFSTSPAVVLGSASATVPDLPGGYTFTFQVLAANGAGVQTPFDVTLSTVVPTIFGQPMISSATFANGISSITWYWSASTGATNYQLFSATGGAVSPLLPTSQLSYVQTGLTANTSYLNYVTAFAVPTSTNSAPFPRATLAAATTALMLLNLVNATAGLSWGANGNPSYTSYDVLWWTGVTSTVTTSVSDSKATVGILPAGGTVYFTVRARNIEGIAADFDSTLYAAVPSTYYAVGVTTIPANYNGVLVFAVPTGAITLTISSGTFPNQTALSILTPVSVPPLTGRFASIPGLNNSGIFFQINAVDVFGAAAQPLKPIAISLLYVPGTIGTRDPATMEISRYDLPQGAWVPLITQRGGNSLSALTDHLSQFAVLGLAAPTDLNSISIGPNPLRPLLNPGQVFTLRNLPTGARVRVFTYVGEKLADLNADASGLASWDGRNAHGNFVASGVYIAVVEGAGTKKTLRLAIER